MDDDDFKDPSFLAALTWDNGPAALSYRSTLGPFVYFLKSGNTIKIGCSATPEMRADQISRGGKAKHPSAGLAARPKLLAYGPGGFALEAEYHYQFYEDLDRGEWFFPSPGLIQLIHDTAMLQARLEVEHQAAYYQSAVLSHGWPAQTFDLDKLTRKRFKKLLRNLPRKATP
ncbi:GIY-YIG nuclease family protein [Arthrobacter sp. GMC3]|uniref:GIY-YIG nuclease family protein n=1 Tax=Arthrobacter sp. GMC3 TaxID=2058894 RepID=UPI000CE3933C|nr:GIY-YIG nuclease family protein [Arthrobacter sp. GMC3]